MGQIAPGDLEFFFFVIPGFVIVWSFRYFSQSQKKGDFEFLGLSVVWGLFMVILFEMLANLECAFGPWWGCSSGNPQASIQQLFSNPYGFAFTFSCVGLVFGWMGSAIVQWPPFRWIIRKSRPWLREETARK